MAVAIIGAPQSTFEEGLRLSPSAQHLRSATDEGLVSFNAAGQVVPGIAERWIVTDDGLSYIFRLRQSDWPDGEEISAEDVRNLLRDTIARLDGTSLGLDLGKIRDIRAMTGRVVEIRLTSPMPEFLQLLAQPEMGLIKDGSGAGPMAMSREPDSAVARLSALPPETRGLPPREDWEEGAQSVSLEAMSAERALEGFTDGDIDLVLNGRFSTFPLIELGPLSRGTIQVDPAWGLFGFAVKKDTGLLATPERREALSMAIDRATLLQGFAISGWQPSTWIAPPEFFTDVRVEDNRWPAMTLDQRIEVARGRIAQWRAEPGLDVTSEGPARIAVAMPDGPGSDLLFRQLVEDWRAIGVSAYRVEPGEDADLELVDRLARYSSPRWFFNQFNCSLKRGLCSPAADEIVQRSLAVNDPVLKQQFFADAQRALVADEVYIPLGAPIRWSLVRGAITGYVPNQWGLHPLFPLSQPPI